MTEPPSAVLEGAISVRAVLDTNSRTVHAIHLADDRNRAKHARLLRDARRCGVPILRATRAELDALATGRTHGGIVATVGPRRCAPLAVLLRRPAPFLAMLDGVEDPYSLGQSIRALYAAGADGLLLPARDLTRAAGIVARASAGASERMPTAVVDDPSAALGTLREHGVRVVCARRRDAAPCDTVDLAGALLLVIGGQHRGIGSGVARHVDRWVRVPYGRGFLASLDTTSATAALSFEIARQRRACG